jgi:hypothetical protein
MFEINVLSDGDGICKMFDEMNEISKSAYRPTLEKRGEHYYFYWVTESFEGKDFKDESNKQRRLLIRKPGRSCGWVQLDENDKIVKTYFYEEVGQDDEMMAIMDKYIGRKVMLKTK